jgi:DNA-binding response OmpR family regulator
VTEPAPDGRRPVLIVDDDRDIRETLRDLLELEGFPAITARDGAEALERMRRDRPCLVLLDLIMPVMDGAEVFRRRAADPDLARVPVAVISAVVDLEHRIAPLEAAGFLEKPVEIERLLELVRRHCV